MSMFEKFKSAWAKAETGDLSEISSLLADDYIVTDVVENKTYNRKIVWTGLLKRRWKVCN